MCIGHSRHTIGCSLPRGPNLGLWLQKQVNNNRKSLCGRRVLDDRNNCKDFLFKKNDNRKINLPSSLNISSLTSEVRSKTAVSWSVAWKEPCGLKEKGGKRREGVETRLSP